MKTVVAFRRPKRVRATKAQAQLIASLWAENASMYVSALVPLRSTDDVLLRNGWVEPEQPGIPDAADPHKFYRVSEKGMLALEEFLARRRAAIDNVKSVGAMG